MAPHEDITAIFAILVIFGMPIAFAMASRWYAHQERMAMIQRGMAPPQNAPFGRGRASYSQPGPAPAAPVDLDYAEWHANRMLHKGIVVGMIGLAITIGLSFINGFVGRPGPWLLGGLIPMFIGIAQIIIAVLSGATFGGMRMSSAPPPPLGQPSQPQAGPYQAPPRDVTPGPYAWRPGATTELERPPSPPDQR